MKKKTIRVNNKLTRQFDAGVRALDPTAEGEVIRYVMTLSSETPYVRFGDLADVWVEVLSHDPSAVNLERADGMPLLMDHTHTDQVGVVESLTLLAAGRTTEAEVRFSRSDRAQEIEQDVADRIRRNVSVGYFVDEYTRTGTSPEGYPIFTATRWTPYEASIVSVPADPKVGFGRAAEGDSGVIVIEEETTTVNRVEQAKAALAAAQEAAAKAAADVKAAIDAGNTPSAELFSAAAAAATAVAEAQTELDAATAEEAAAASNQEDPAAAEKAAADKEAADKAAADAKAEADAAQAASNQQEDEAKAQADQQRALHAEVTRIATAAGMADKAAGFIQRNLSVDQVAKEILTLRRSVSTVTQPTVKKDSQVKYTLARAIQVALGVATGGVEAELDAKIAAALPDSYRRHGARSIFVPISAAQVRALNTGTAGAGAEVVFEEQGEFIELLRNRSVVFENGARSYTNLRGPVSFPRQVGGAIAHWVSENPGVDVEDSQALFTSVTLSPKTLQSSTAISRQLLTQSAIDINSVVMDDLATAHALAIDRAALHGAGGTEPVGIYNAPGVAAVDMSTGVTHGKLVDMVTEVAAANALIGDQAFVTTPRVAGRLAQTLVAAESGAGFIWTGKLTDGTVIGYDATASNQVKSNMGVANDEHGLVFGTFSDVMVGTWGIMELVVDEYSLKKQGLIEITTFQMADVALRHGASFAKATGLKLN